MINVNNYYRLVSDIKNYFIDVDYEIIDMNKLLVYLGENNLLVNDSYLINRCIENHEIRCPYRYLNVDVMLDDYKDCPIDIFNMNSDDLFYEFHHEELVNNKILYDLIV